MATKRLSMRERVAVEMPIYETTNYGQKKIVDWQTLEEGVPARWEHTGGTETFRGRQIQPEVIGVFTMRVPRGYDVQTTHRIIHQNENDKIYHVHSARPFEGQLEGGFQYIEVFVRAIAENDV